MRFFVHSEPEEFVRAAVPLLQEGLDRRVSPYHPKVFREAAASHVTVELAFPAPGTAGADEEVIAAVEDAVPSSVGLLIWAEVSEERNTLLFIRASAGDPYAAGESYIRPNPTALHGRTAADTLGGKGDAG